MSGYRRSARFVARETHEVPARVPLRVAPGEVVMVERRESDWPAFVFVTADHGSGWVPARHLSADAGSAVVLVAYDTTELAADAGEALELLERDDESGWHWCRADDGREGWVPARILRPASTPPAETTP